MTKKKGMRILGMVCDGCNKMKGIISYCILKEKPKDKALEYVWKLCPSCLREHGDKTDRIIKSYNFKKQKIYKILGIAVEGL